MWLSDRKAVVVLLLGVVVAAFDSCTVLGRGSDRDGIPGFTFHTTLRYRSFCGLNTASVPDPVVSRTNVERFGGLLLHFVDSVDGESCGSS